MNLSLLSAVGIKDLFVSGLRKLWLWKVRFKLTCFELEGNPWHNLGLAAGIGLEAPLKPRYRFSDPAPISDVERHHPLPAYQQVASGILPRHIDRTFFWTPREKATERFLPVS